MCGDGAVDAGGGGAAAARPHCAPWEKNSLIVCWLGSSWMLMAVPTTGRLGMPCTRGSWVRRERESPKAESKATSPPPPL